MVVVVVVIVSCTLAPIPQCGGSREKLSHAKGRESGALGRLEWLPVPLNPVLLESLAKLPVLFILCFFFLFLRCVKLYQDTMKGECATLSRWDA